jgi:hypothetical protein
VRRALFWLAVLVALAAVVIGGAYAYVGYRATSGPGGTVKGYFAAIARSDAPAALGFGDVPSGSHALLTSQVLAEQQRIAPLHDLQIIDVAQAGDQATVRYRYQLRFARGNQEFTGALDVVHRGSSWRLTRTAVATTLRLTQAADRIALAGSSVPDGTALLFPGALPVRIDTPYLQLDPTTAAVQFAGDATTDLSIEPTTAARATLVHALTAKLTACVSGANATASCPLPSSRFVPGSLSGRIVSNVDRAIDFEVGSAADGTISMRGTLAFSGRYRRLDFDNVAHTRTGRLSLHVQAEAYAVAPLTVRFEATS